MTDCDCIVCFCPRSSDLQADNKRLREALEEIYDKTDGAKSKLISNIAGRALWR